MDFQLLFVFKVGHSVQLRSKPVANRTHHWRCYVDSWSPRYPLSAFVKKVTFNLHDTFDNPRQVVRQAPFAIEEDGFGNFRLQIEVAFLNCVTSFHYDLTLFDNNALHAYRTVRIEPNAYDWESLVRLGGIIIPRENNPSDVHKVVQIIQSCQNVESLHPRSFFPHLFAARSSSLEQSPSGFSTDDSPPAKRVESTRLSPDHSARALVTSEPPESRFPQSNHHPLVNDPKSLPLSLSQLPQPLPQKHKKKFQLLHEAELLLEDAKNQQSKWASQSKGTIPGGDAVRYSMLPLSPNIPNWTGMKTSPSSAQKQQPPLKDKSPPLPSLPSSTPVKVEQCSPGKRIVLKLSLRGSGNQISVAREKKRESSEERRERRRRKREQKSRLTRKQQQIRSEFSPDEKACEDLPITKQDSLPREQTPQQSENGKCDGKDSFGNREPPFDVGPDKPLDNLSSEWVHKPASYDPPSNHTNEESEKMIRFSLERELFGSDNEVADMPERVGGDCVLSPAVSRNHSNEMKPANQSHLLLDTLDEDFDDPLSRSLFSQCYDSANADSASVDLFGDEELPQPVVFDNINDIGTNRKQHAITEPSGNVERESRDEDEDDDTSPSDYSKRRKTQPPDEIPHSPRDLSASIPRKRKSHHRRENAEPPKMNRIEVRSKHHTTPSESDSSAKNTTGKRKASPVRSPSSDEGTHMSRSKKQKTKSKSRSTVDHQSSADHDSPKVMAASESNLQRSRTVVSSPNGDSSLLLTSSSQKCSDLEDHEVSIKSTSHRESLNSKPHSHSDRKSRGHSNRSTTLSTSRSGDTDRNNRVGVYEELNIELSSLSSAHSSSSSPTPPMSSAHSPPSSSSSLHPSKSTMSSDSLTESSVRSRKNDVDSSASGSTTHCYSNEELENLFDRLLMLEHPHLAVRMGEILLPYVIPRNAKGPDEEKLTKGNQAVKVLHKDEPRVLAFNLRRLPPVCLDQLKELIKEDEALSMKKASRS